MKKLLPLLLVGLLPLPLQGETAIWSNGWSGGDGPAGIPDANDDVLLLSGNLTWDTALPKTVGSWNQHAAYGDTVTFHTTHPDYDTAFTNLHIFGDCIVSNGTWQHRGDQPSTEQQQRYWLGVRVGGDFVLGSNATISVDEQGFNNAGPGQGGG